MAAAARDGVAGVTSPAALDRQDALEAKLGERRQDRLQGTWPVPGRAVELLLRVRP